MNILIIGATGLLGSQAARELIERGHGVAGLALPPIMPDTPPEMAVTFLSYLDMTDDELFWPCLKAAKGWCLPRAWTSAWKARRRFTTSFEIQRHAAFTHPAAGKAGGRPARGGLRLVLFLF